MTAGILSLIMMFDVLLVSVVAGIACLIMMSGVLAGVSDSWYSVSNYVVWCFCWCQ